MLGAPIGKAERIRSANMKFRGFVYVCCASPNSRVQIFEQTVLAQHKENERICEARIIIRSALPIVLEIT
jgi:hypothetical protein